MAFVALGAFIGLGFGLSLVLPLDAWAAANLPGDPDSPLWRFARFLTRNSPYLAAALVALGAGVAAQRGESSTRIFAVLGNLAIGLLLFESLKLTCIRSRPGGLMLHPVADSFPSGHVANAALCVATAIELVRRRLPRPEAVQALSAAGALFVLAVAYTRLYFQLHWLSDVVASLLLGLAFAAFVSARWVHTWRRGAVALLAVALVYTLTICGGRIRLPAPNVLLGRFSTVAAASRTPPSPTRAPTGPQRVVRFTRTHTPLL